MKKESAIKLFESKQVRTVWSDEEEKWYFSIVDVVAVLTNSPNGNNYWKVLKNRLSKEGSELVTNCNQLKMPSSDGKYYKTDVADTRKAIEEKSGKKIVTSQNAKTLKRGSEKKKLQ